MKRSLVWVPSAISVLKETAPEELEVAEIPDVPESSDRLGEVELMIVEKGRPGLDLLWPKMTKLQVIQTMYAGIDGVIDLVPEGVVLCSTKGSYGIVAEWVVGAILSDFKAFALARDDQLAGHWNPRPVRRLIGSTVLLLGYGSIAQEVEERLRPFGTEFLRVARRPRPGVVTLEELPALLPEADIVVVLVPLTTETEGLVDGAFLAKMKRGALLINAARGPVVDTEALMEALRREQLTAVLDVTDPEPLPDHHPLFAAPNVFITPHIAGGGLARPEVLQFLQAQLGRFARHEALHNVARDGY